VPTPEARVYDPWDRPDVEVLVDGQWCPGELRAWFPDEVTGSWRANVSWRREYGRTFIETVVADRVRPDPSYCTRQT